MELDEAAREILAKGYCRMLVVSLGAKGLYWPGRIYWNTLFLLLCLL
jgi:hypothetical protein